MKTITLTLLLLTSSYVRANQTDAQFWAGDPCHLKTEVMTDDYKSGFIKLIAYIVKLEAKGNSADKREALGLRRTINGGNPLCYSWASDKLGLGVSPLTGE